MLRLLCTILCTCVLVGCATQAQIYDGLQTFVGKPLDYAVSQLGYPTSRQPLADRFVYVWNESSSGTVNLPRTEYSQGTAYTSDGPVTYSGYVTQSVPTRLDIVCVVYMEVDNSNKIVHATFRASLGSSCDRFAKLVPHTPWD